jgi:2-polyprenyl-3-methyl-5-hydroxy-6-metoxy-1,4-benzoquinol methylase
MMTDDAGYLFEGADPDSELGRLRLIESCWDSITTACFERLGVIEGWRCIDIGAGAGSVARWLAHRVGPTGSVVAADIDPKFLTGLAENVRVQQLDIREGDLEEGGYDLVHWRSLLWSLPDPLGVVTRSAAAVRPGGILFGQELDLGLLHLDGHPDADHINSIIQKVLHETRQAKLTDARIGRRLPGLLALAGIEVLDTEITTEVAQPGEPLYEYQRRTDTSAMPIFARQGILTEAEAALVLSFYDQPGTALISATLVSSWGRRPETSP